MRGWRPAAVAGGLRRLPLPVFWLSLAALWLAGEEYPFSTFPMYDNFEDRATYFYVTAGDGRPVPLDLALGQRTSELKKRFERELRAERESLRRQGRSGLKLADLPAESVHSAAGRTLQWLADSARRGEPPPDQMVLHRVELSLREGRIISTGEPVGRWP